MDFWGQSVTPGNLLFGDPPGEGFVGGNDLDMLRMVWSLGTPPDSIVLSVPELGKFFLSRMAGRAALRHRLLQNYKR